MTESPKRKRLNLWPKSDDQYERWEQAAQKARRELPDWAKLVLDDAADRELSDDGK